MSKSVKSTKSSVIADTNVQSKALSGKPSPAREQSGAAEIKIPQKTRATTKPAPAHDQPICKSGSGTKLEEIIAMLRTKQGVSIDEIAEAVGWQRHSVHGLISGKLRKKQGLNVVNEVVDGVRVYRIVK